MHDPQTERRERILDLAYDYLNRPKRSASSCNLCGSGRFVTLTQTDRYGYPARADGCLRCGLVFLNPVMTAEAYTDFYRETYRPLVSAYHGRRIDARTIQDEQRVYAQERGDLLARCIESVRLSTLLDIGGSTGVVAHALAERFKLRATVLDPAPLEIAEARSLGIETISGFIEDYRPQKRKFDLITLCQTVDHLLDIRGSLVKIRRLLSHKGIFFVDIVDLRAAYLRTWRVEEAVKIDHPYYLTESSMSAYLRRAGFQVVHTEYAADHLHVSFVCSPAPSRPASLPATDEVAHLWRELRFVQNAPRPR